MSKARLKEDVDVDEGDLINQQTSMGISEWRGPGQSKKGPLKVYRVVNNIQYLKEEQPWWASTYDAPLPLEPDAGGVEAQASVSAFRLPAWVPSEDLRVDKKIGKLENKKGSAPPASAPEKELLKEEFFLVTAGPEVDPETRRHAFDELKQRGLKVEPWTPPLAAESAPASQSEPVRGRDATTVPLLPDGRPRLWAERTTGREVSPADFIRQHYGRTGEDGAWDPMGLTRADLARLDPPLYNAYAQWISRPSNKAIDALSSEPRTRIVDPAAAMEDRRRRDRERKLVQRHS